MANESQSFSIRDYVRIVTDFEEPTLQGQTGTVVELPDQLHVKEYKVRLDGRLLKSSPLAGNEVWLPADVLRESIRLR